MANELTPAVDQEAVMAEALHQAKAGNMAEAEALYRSLIDSGSKNSMVYANLGVLCGLNQRFEERLSLLRQALELDPHNYQAQMNLGIALKENDELEAAQDCFQVCLKQKPESAAALTGLGSVAEKQRNLTVARRYYNHALELDSGFRDAHLSLGILELEAGDGSAAEGYFRYCLGLDPADTTALRHLASSLLRQEQLDEALELLHQGVERYPGDLALMLELVKMLHGRGKADEALQYCLRAIALSPESANVMAWCGHCLQSMNLYGDAIECFAKAHELDPTDLSVLNLWAGCLSDLGDFDGALDLYEKALRLSSEDPCLHMNQASVLRNAGRLEEAIALFETGIKKFPDELVNFAFPLMFSYSIASETYAQKALDLGGRAWERVRQGLSAEAVCGSASVMAASPALGEPIRIGILCPDLGDHVVSRFLLPFLRHYNRAKLTVELILSTRRYEQRAEEIMALANGSLSICGLEELAARAALKARGYHVIVETSGMTRNSAITLLAERCAPVQCHYIGYHATTALDTIDYFIGDAITAPEEFAWQFTERLWRLPRVWLAIEHPEPLPPARLGRDSEPLILGSFNQLTKLRAETIRYWGEALRQLPSSQLVLKDRATGNASMRQQLEHHLAQFGVVPERIHYLHPVGSWAEHMDLYNGIDIALDATPWSGATTTVEALSMGVPLVAIRGSCTAARMSSAIVASCGLPPSIADTPDQFAKIVAVLGQDLEFLRQGRAERQHTVLTSPLFDGLDLAHSLEEAFAGMLSARLSSVNILS